MLRVLTYEQVVEWEAYFELEPWGTLVEDDRFGVLAVWIAEQYRDSKKTKRPFDPSDFFTRLKPRYTAKQLEEIEKRQADDSARTAAYQHELYKREIKAKQAQKAKRVNGRKNDKPN